ncbi:MAG: SBBP repeat-containing protein [Pyrinomonadaceae bacterium]
MKKSTRPLLKTVAGLATLLLAVGFVLWLTGARTTGFESRDLSGTSTDTRPDAPLPWVDDFARMPLGFEVNAGQTADEVRFISRGEGYTLFLTPTEAVFAAARRGKVAGHLKLRLAGANAAPVIGGSEPLGGKANYFIGSDPANWRTNVAMYARVDYKEVYPGIDLVYYGNQRELEYDFVVAPNADPAVVAWSVAADHKPNIDDAGRLVLQLGESQVYMNKPVVYQHTNGGRMDIDAGYVLADAPDEDGMSQITFDIGEYDRSQTLVIDPVVVFSSALLDGSGSDSANSITVDADGNAYVTGTTTSTNFPTVGAFQSSLSGFQDAFVSKFNAAGTALLYSTYLGGSTGFENGWDIAADAAGNAYVTGQTVAPDFPTTPNALQPTKLTSGSTQDTAFFTRLGPTGALVYSTFLSGTQSNRAFGIATDGAGNAYITGEASSLGFPLTPSAFSSTAAGTGFLTKLNTNASGAASLVYSTYLGPTGTAAPRAIAVDASGSAYITGNASSTSTNFASPGSFQSTYGGGTADAFVAKFNTNLSGAASRIYSTYIGGGGNDFGGTSAGRGSKAIAIDAAANAYVTGTTSSTNFPVAGAFQGTAAGGGDAFLTKLNPSGSALVYSTYLGGSGVNSDEGRSVAVNVVGNAYVTGLTTSANFPTAAPLSTGDGTTGGAFLTKFSPAGNSLVYSTRFGQVSDVGLGLGLDGAGNAFVTSIRASATFVTEIADPTVIGRVLDEDGLPLAGAAVSLTGTPTGAATTDANGYYTFGLLTPANSYNVSVSVPNYIFLSRPANNLVKNVRLDFTPVVNTISGQVLNDCAGLAGATVNLTDGKSLTRTTDASGNYSFANLPAGRNYTVTPIASGLTFTPPSRSFANLFVDQSGNFVAPALASVAGGVFTPDGRGLRNAMVTITDLSTGVARSVTTSSFGFYSFDNVATTITYTLRVGSRRYRFAARSLPVNCNMANVDFTGLE